MQRQKGKNVLRRLGEKVEHLHHQHGCMVGLVWLVEPQLLA
jgi:hypothetical protein